MKNPKRKRAPGGGRKKEGRVRNNVQMLPEAWDKLDAMQTPERNSRGKVIEKLLGL